MTVHLLQQPAVHKSSGWTPDFSGAMQYGEMKVLLTADEKPSFMPGPLLHRIRQWAKNEFSYETDYLLWAGGDPVTVALTACALTEAHVPYFQVLRWERERSEGHRTGGGYYIPVKIELRKE